ncbi:MAG: EAL domain-containing protein [Gammaproteobacteria bacterium]|nr:EAL domain-containing protein [Gammaproteobacteria bacterium]
MAEGIEYKYQLKYLKEAGCHLIQGYYFYTSLSTSDSERSLI